MRGARPLPLVLLLAFLLALALPFFAQAPTDTVLTNADVVRMVKAGIPENIIVRELQMSPAELDTSPAALIELKKRGASERVLDAVLDSRMGASQPSSEALPPAQVVVRPAVHGMPRLPSFEANVKSKGNNNTKIRVSHNQIKVERSGVPLFSVKWEEKPDDK